MIDCHLCRTLMLFFNITKQRLIYKYFIEKYTYFHIKLQQWYQEVYKYFARHCSSGQCQVCSLEQYQVT